MASGGRVGGAAEVALATGLQLYATNEKRDTEFVVGVIDTGVVKMDDGEPHPFLAQHLAPGWMDNLDVLPGNDRLGPHDGHGTFVAGLIHHRAPTATIDVRNALDKTADQADDIRSNDRQVADQITALAGVEHLKLVNLSFFGDDAPEPEPPPEIRSALRYLVEHKPDVLVVTAAGNRWTDEPTWPARFKEEVEQVIAVGAMDDTVTPVPGLAIPRASFSNYWTGIDVYAPGVRVLGPYVQRTNPPPDDPAAQAFTGWCLWSGTSFAAATVTGLLAAAMISKGLTGPEARERVIRRLFRPVPGQEPKPALVAESLVHRQSAGTHPAGG